VQIDFALRVDRAGRAVDGLAHGGVVADVAVVLHMNEKLDVAAGPSPAATSNFSD
jgi:hypothetical protein